MIAWQAQSTFNRILAGSITLTFFVYIFVNMGMVSGILPVVGVPLPLISYGGSSMIASCVMLGLLLRIERELPAVGKAAKAARGSLSQSRQ